MKFKAEFLKRGLWEDISEDESFEIISDEISDTTRWSELHDLVFMHNGKLYETDYSCGLTEMQDESPFEYADDEIECPEVEAYEKTVTAYRRIAA